MTDTVMPGMNGVELARRLLAIRPHMKVLLTSGYSDGVEEPPLGASFIAKPFMPDALIQKLAELLVSDRSI